MERYKGKLKNNWKFLKIRSKRGNWEKRGGIGKVKGKSKNNEEIKKSLGESGGNGKKIKGNSINNGEIWKKIRENRGEELEKK